MTADRAAYLAALDYLTAEEAAELLRIGRHQIYRLVNSHQLACTKFGKRLVFSRSELDRFMAQHEHHAPTPMTPAAQARIARAN